MNRILRSDWLPERATWAHLAHSGFPVLVPRENVLLLAGHINRILTKLVRSLSIQTQSVL